MAADQKFLIELQLLASKFKEGTDEVARSSNRAAAATDKLSKSVDTVKRAIVAVAFGALAKQAAQLAISFGDAFTQINTLVGVNRQQVDAWRKDILALGPEVGRSSVELAKALFVVTSAGERTAKALDIVEGAGKAAALGMGEAADIARIVTAATQAYRAENLSSGQALDQLVAIIREGNLEAADLASTFGKVIPVAQAAGVSFGQAGGFIATFTRLGVNAAESVTALKALLQIVINPSKDAAKALASVGSSADQVRESIRERGLATTLVDLVNLFGDNTEVLARVIPSAEAFSAVLGTAKAQAADFLAIERGVINATGTLAEAFDAAKDTPGQALREFGVELENLKIALGAGLAIGLKDAVGQLREFLDQGDNAAAVGRALGDVLVALARAVKFLADNWDVLKYVLLAVVAIKVQLWADAVAVALARMAASTGLAASAATLLLTPVSKLGPALRALVAADLAAKLGAVAVSIGLITAAAIALGYALYKLIDWWKRVTVSQTQYLVSVINLEGALARLRLESLKGGGVVSAAAFDAGKAAAEGFKTRIAELNQELAELKRASAEGTANPFRPGRQAEVEEEIKRLTVQQTELAKLLASVKVAADEAGESLGDMKPPVNGLGGAVGDLTARLLALRKALDDLKRRISVFQGLKLELDQIRAQMEAWELKLKGQPQQWRLVQLAVEHGLNPLTELDPLMAEWLLRLDDVKAAWEGIQDATRDATQEGLDFLRGLGNIGADASLDDLLDKLKDLGIELDGLPKAVLQAQRTATLGALDALANNDSFQELLESLGTTAEDLRDNIIGAFEGLELRLELDFTIPQEPFVQIESRFRQLFRRVGEFLNNHIEQWAGFGSAVAAIFDTLGGQIGQVIQQAARLLDALAAAAKVQQGDYAGAAVAGAAVGQSVFGIGQSLGAWQGNRGTGTFGGQLSGDYADTGAAVGAVAGAIIGSFVPVIGTALGGMIGGLIGGVIGGAIKQGADEGLGTLRQVAGDAAFSIEKSEGGLGRIIGDIAGSVADAVNSISDILGADLVQVAGIQFKVRDDLIRVFAGGVTAVFSDVNEAINYAIVQAAKYSQYAGVSPAVQAALQDRANRSLQDLQENLAIATSIDNISIPKAAQEVMVALQGIDLQFGQFVDKAAEWGLSLQQLTELGQGYGRGLLDLRDSITGTVKSERQIFEERRQVYNLELEQRRTGLQIERDQLQARLELLTAEAQAYQANLEAGLFFVQGMGRFAEEVGGIGASVMRSAAYAAQSVAEIQARLAYIDAALASLPTAIDASEFRPSGGGGRRQAIENFLQTIESLQRQALPEAARAIADTRDRMAELAAEATRLGQSLEQVLLIQGAALAELQRRFVLDPIRPYLPESPLGPYDSFPTPGSIQGGTYGMTDFERQAAEIRAQFAAISEANRLLAQEQSNLYVDQSLINQAQRNALRELGQAAIDSLGLPLRQTMQTMQQWGEALDFVNGLVQQGIMTQGEYAAALAELANVAFTSFGDNLFGFLDRYYSDVAGFEAFRRQLEQVRFDMEFANLQLQFQQLQALGLLTEAQIASIQGVIDYIIDHPINWDEWFTPPPPPAPPPVTTAGVFGSSATDQKLDRLLSQLSQWRDLSLSAAERELKALYQTRDEMLDLARELGRSTADVMAAFQVALNDFWTRLKSGLQQLYDTMLTGQGSPLSAGQQLQVAQGRVDELLRRLAANPQDIGAIEQLSGALSGLLSAAQLYTGGVGPLYQNIFNMIRGILESQLGGRVLGGDVGNQNTAANVFGNLSEQFRSGVGNLGIIPPPATPPQNFGAFQPSVDPYGGSERYMAAMVTELRVANDLARAEASLDDARWRETQRYYRAEELRGRDTKAMREAQEEMRDIAERRRA